jgi:hypothetical protein
MKSSKIKVIIKSFDCVDHDPIEEWIPGDINDIDIWITFSIGPSDEVGADYFQGHFITKNYLKHYGSCKLPRFFSISSRIILA